MLQRETYRHSLSYLLKLARWLNERAVHFPGFSELELRDRSRSEAWEGDRRKRKEKKAWKMRRKDGSVGKALEVDGKERKFCDRKRDDGVLFVCRRKEIKVVVLYC